MPSESLAEALTVMLAGAVKLDPPLARSAKRLAADWSRADVTVTLTGADVVESPSLSVAIADSLVCARRRNRDAHAVRRRDVRLQHLRALIEVHLADRAIGIARARRDGEALRGTRTSCLLMGR